VYICHLDESGVVDTVPTSSHYVLLGLAIPAVTWRDKDRSVSQLAQHHRIGGCEIHAAWMARRYPEQERVPGFDKMSDQERRRAVQRERKADLVKAQLRGVKAVRSLARNYKLTEPFVHMSHEERLSVLRSLADLVGQWDDARIFAEAHDKASARRGAPERILDDAFEQVVSRFHHFLDKKKATVGILVHDSNQTTQKHLTAMMRRFHDSGTLWTAIPKIAETPLFVDSSLTSMVQVADLCSFAVRRHFEKGESDLFDRFYDRFDRLGNGKLVGLRHFTGRRRCGCRACRDHGRE
jgi:hypothetical protein